VTAKKDKKPKKEAEPEILPPDQGGPIVQPFPEDFNSDQPLSQKQPVQFNDDTPLAQPEPEADGSGTQG
jgi:hypothetical protein